MPRSDASSVAHSIDADARRRHQVRQELRGSLVHVLGAGDERLEHGDRGHAAVAGHGLGPARQPRHARERGLLGQVGGQLEVRVETRLDPPVRLEQQPPADHHRRVRLVAPEGRLVGRRDVDRPPRPTRPRTRRTAGTPALPRPVPPTTPRRRRPSRLVARRLRVAVPAHRRDRPSPPRSPPRARARPRRPRSPRGPRRRAPRTARGTGRPRRRAPPSARRPAPGRRRRRVRTRAPGAGTTGPRPSPRTSGARRGPAGRAPGPPRRSGLAGPGSAG